MVFNVCKVKVSMDVMDGGVCIMEVSVKGCSTTLTVEHLYNSHPGTELSNPCGKVSVVWKFQ